MKGDEASPRIPPGGVTDREPSAGDLRLMAETGSSFDEWLNWEAFLACTLREASYTVVGARQL